MPKVILTLFLPAPLFERTLVSKDFTFQDNSWLEQNATQDDACHGEVDDQAGDVNERGHKRGGGAGGIQSTTAQDKWQHGTRERAKHDHPDQTTAYGKSDHQIVLPVGPAQRVPKKNSRDADDPEDCSEYYTREQLPADHFPPIAKPNFAERHRPNHQCCGLRARISSAADNQRDEQGKNHRARNFFGE